MKWKRKNVTTEQADITQGRKFSGIWLIPILALALGIYMVVDNLMIPGRDEIEARRKLRQIYRDCEILDCVCVRGTLRTPVSSFEDVVSLITR